MFLSSRGGFGLAVGAAWAQWEPILGWHEDFNLLPIGEPAWFADPALPIVVQMVAVQAGSW